MRQTIKETRTDDTVIIHTSLSDAIKLTGISRTSLIKAAASGQPTNSGTIFTYVDKDTTASTVVALRVNTAKLNAARDSLVAAGVPPKRVNSVLRAALEEVMDRYQTSSTEKVLDQRAITAATSYIAA